MMNNELIFRLLLLILLVAFVAHRGYYNRKFNPDHKTTLQKQENGWVTKLINLLSLPALLGTFLYILVPDWMAWAALPLPGWWRWAGVGIALAGFALLQWSHLALGQNWSDQPRLMQEQGLTTNGPYRWIRHPIYTAFLFIMGSIFFLSANWFIGLLWFVASTLDILARIQFEEALLAKHFGEPYRMYMKRTGRLLPKLSR